MVWVYINYEPITNLDYLPVAFLINWVNPIKTRVASGNNKKPLKKAPKIFSEII